MSALPLEIWKLVVEASHRPIPAAGEKVNWNDHLNQGDLLALQRTCKAMYELVTPVLYTEPIVQDLGLFLKGIDEPTPEVTVPHDESAEPKAPLHKRRLLQRTRKLHLVAASSRNVVRPHLTLTNRAYEFPSPSLVDIDVLGRADLDGMQEANRILERVEGQQGSEKVFPNLQAVSFGSWDDGRWASYTPGVASPYRQQGQLDVGNLDLRSMLDELTQSFSIFRDMNLCVTLRQGILSVFPGVAERDTYSQSGMRVLHKGNFRDLRYIYSYPGPSRIYLGTDWLVDYRNGLEYPSDVREPFRSYGWAMYLSAPRQIWSDERIAAFKRSSMELCIVPRGPGDRADQEALAREVKEALELYHEEACKTKGDARLWKDRVKILVGEEVPACPCCGSRD